MKGRGSPESASCVLDEHFFFGYIAQKYAKMEKIVTFIFSVNFDWSNKLLVSCDWPESATLSFKPVSGIARYSERINAVIMCC